MQIWSLFSWASGCPLFSPQFLRHKKTLPNANHIKISTRCFQGPGRVFATARRPTLGRSFPPIISGALPTPSPGNNFFLRFRHGFIPPLCFDFQERLGSGVGFCGFGCSSPPFPRVSLNLPPSQPQIRQVFLFLITFPPPPLPTRVLG